MEELSSSLPNDDELCFIDNNGGKAVIYENRHYHRLRDYKNGWTVLRCTAYRKHKCKGTLTVKGKQVVKSNPHSCPQDLNKITIIREKAKLKQAAISSDRPIPQLHAESIIQMKVDGHGSDIVNRCNENGSHQFPRDVRLRKLWEKATKIANFKSMPNSRLCSKHFKESDYQGLSSTTGKPQVCKHLRKGVVPSIFSWTKTASELVSERAKRYTVQTSERQLFPVENIQVTEEIVLMAEDEHYSPNLTTKQKCINVVNSTIQPVENVVETVEMFDLKACRCCLLTEGKLTKLNDQNKKLYNMITGFEIKPRDGLPTRICVECAMYMKKIMQFRRKCRRAHFVLNEIITTEKQVTVRILKAVNRECSNLVSQLSATQFEIVDIQSKYPTLNTYLSNEDLGHFIYPNTGTINNNLTPNIVSNNSNTVNIASNNSNIVNTASVINNVAVNSSDIDTETVIGNDDGNVTNIDYDDDFVNDDTMLENKGHDDIDMEDIFKGLEEDEDFCVESEPEELPMPPEPEKIDKKALRKSKKEAKENDTKLIENKSYAMFYGVVPKCVKLSTLLLNTDIKVLDEEEQLATRKAKMNQLSFQNTPFKCVVCVAEFKSLELLKHHVIVHNLGLQYKYRCNICKLPCETEENLRMHGANFHWYWYTCRTCGEASNYLGDIVNCYREHGLKVKNKNSFNLLKSLINKYFDKSRLTPEEARQPPPLYEGNPSKVKCDICKVYLPKPRYLDAHRHKLPQPLNKPYLECDNCHSLLIDKRGLTMHMRTYHTYKFKCKICDTFVYNIPQVEAHLTSHDKLKCESCPQKELVTARGFKLHQRTVHPDLVCEEDCNICGNKLKDLQRLYEHQLKTHGYLSLNDPKSCDPELKCQKCDKQFISKMAYSTHLVKSKHADVHSIENACIECWEVFESKELLDDHMCRYRKYPTSCKYCNVELNDWYLAKRHRFICIGADASDIVKKKHLCELCGQVLQTSSGLSQHMKTHSENKANHYQCMFCKAKLFRVDHYLAHILRSHTYKAYMCALCPARFPNKSDCRSHILRSHAPAKPYSCDFCGRGFSLVSYLSAHVKKMHDAKLDTTKYHRKTHSDFTGCLELYPFMKINATHVPVDIFKLVGIATTDFLGLNPTTLESYDDVLVFDDQHPPIVELVKKHKIDKKHTQDEPKSKKRKVIIDNDTEIATDETAVAVSNIKMKGTSQIETDNNEVEYNEENSHEIPVVTDEKIVKIEADEQLSAEMVQEEISKGNYDVIKHEGETCLLINGVVYKIEETE